jgi:cephalosporin hydroxylase
MRMLIDTETRSVTLTGADGDDDTIDLYSPEAFALLNELWVKVGWSLRYPYRYTWLGRPIIQLPDDVMVVQETITRVQPTLVVETGVAHGGSLVLSASVMHSLGRPGRVIGIDVEIREHNRVAIESHPLADRITLVEGDSSAPSVVDSVAAMVRDDDVVLVILDSDHSRAHVLAELEAYAPLVTPGSYALVADGAMEILHDVPRGEAAWRDDNPAAAVRTFLASHPEFTLEEPGYLFDETPAGVARATHWRGGFLRRREA